MALSRRTRAGEGERDGQRRIPAGCGHHAGHGLVDVDPIRSAQHCLTVFEGTPGKAHARLKVLVVLVIDRIDVLSRRARAKRVCGIEDDEPIVTFARRHVPFVTQAEFQRQIRSQLCNCPGQKIPMLPGRCCWTGCPASH